jgi:hypothetical protein
VQIHSRNAQVISPQALSRFGLDWVPTSSFKPNVASVIAELLILMGNFDFPAALSSRNYDGRQFIEQYADITLPLLAQHASNFTNEIALVSARILSSLPALSAISLIEEEETR